MGRIGGRWTRVPGGRVGPNRSSLFRRLANRLRTGLQMADRILHDHELDDFFEQAQVTIQLGDRFGGDLDVEKYVVAFPVPLHQVSQTALSPVFFLENGPLGFGHDLLNLRGHGRLFFGGGIGVQNVNDVILDLSHTLPPFGFLAGGEGSPLS